MMARYLLSFPLPEPIDLDSVGFLINKNSFFKAIKYNNFQSTVPQTPIAHTC